MQHPHVNPYYTLLRAFGNAPGQAAAGPQNTMGCSCQFPSRTSMYGRDIGAPLERACPCVRDCCANSGDPSAYKVVCGEVVQVKPNTLGATNALRHAIPPADWSRYMSA